MAGTRDWDKEMAKIDRLIAAQGAAPPAPSHAATGPATPRAQTLPATDGGGRIAAWARVGLGALLGIAITQWPYAHACGVPLFLYLAAVATVAGAGLWGAIGAWRRRLPLAHAAAVAVIVWSLVVAAHAVLPRVGYARASASWFCSS